MAVYCILYYENKIILVFFSFGSIKVFKNFTFLEHFFLSKTFFDKIFFALVFYTSFYKISKFMLCVAFVRKLFPVLLHIKLTPGCTPPTLLPLTNPPFTYSIYTLCTVNCKLYMFPSPHLPRRHSWLDLVTKLLSCSWH